MNEAASKYTATIGLEIHAELKTKTKMFCACKNDPDEKRPNVNICPVCTAQPGTLPVLNKAAIEHVIRVGLACGADIADFTEWDRKNYFYPDIPKGYQISQYKYPIVSHGSIRGIELTRIHLEEDTAKSTHDAGDYSLVDFNRGGVALMELVTEPVIHSGADAAMFAKELQLLLQYLGAGDANMEKGEMRVEANISVSKTEVFGTKVEVKNLNSFNTVQRAIAYEIERQIDAYERGETIVQETRGWDENKQKTYSQRIKENSDDYRYFPDPDLPKMMLREVFDFEKLKKELPELPWQYRERYEIMGISKDQLDVYLSNNIFGKKLGVFFNTLQKYLESSLLKLASNYIVTDLASNITGNVAIEMGDNYKKGIFNDRELEDKYLNKIFEPNFSENFSKIILMVSNGKISSRVAKDLIARLVLKNENPEEIAEKEGLIQKSDEGELKIILQSLIAENPNVVADYKSGKEAALMFFVGQVMKITKGSANPQIIKKVLLEVLA